MRSVYSLSLFMTIWGFLAQGCMSFRISDDEAKRHFQNKGMSINIQSLKIENRSIHYASAGSDDLPTLLFIHGTPGSWNAFMDYMQDTALLKQFRVISVDRPGFGYSDFGKPLNITAQSAILNEWMQQIQNGKPVNLIGPVSPPLISDLPNNRRSRFICVIL